MLMNERTLQVGNHYKSTSKSRPKAMEEAERSGCADARDGELSPKSQKYWQIDVSSHFRPVPYHLSYRPLGPGGESSRFVLIGADSCGAAGLGSAVLSAGCPEPGHQGKGRLGSRSSRALSSQSRARPFSPARR